MTPSSLKDERQSIVDQLEDWLETPMLVLGFIWLVLTILELTRGLSPFLENLSTLIWMIFILDFGLKLAIAPRKLVYMRRNWITLLSLLLPALRILRFSRAFRAARFLKLPPGARLIRLVSSFNRGMKSLGRSLGRRGFGYVAGLTLMVTILGAAGIYAIEFQADGYIHDYGTALWWTAMTLTTMGTDYFPGSPEGRLLCLLLATYGFAVFGYVTATVASLFVEREASDEESSLASEESLRRLQAEIMLLREELKDLKKGLIKG